MNKQEFKDELMNAAVNGVLEDFVKEHIDTMTDDELKETAKISIMKLLNNWNPTEMKDLLRAVWINDLRRVKF